MPAASTKPDVWPPATEIFLSNGLRSPLGTVTIAGFIRHSPGIGHERPRRFGSHALVLLLDGRGFYRDEAGTHRELHPGDGILIFPELGHTYGPLPGHTWSELHVCFWGPAFDALQAAGLMRPDAPLLRAQPIRYWTQRLVEAVGRQCPDTVDASLRQCARLLDGLGELLGNQRQTDGAAAASDWLRRAREALRRHGDGPAAARTLGCGYENFRKRYRQLAGEPPGRALERNRLEEACRLLQTTELTSRAIAAQLGYCDEYHFAKRFKQVMGTTPGSLRRKLDRSSFGHL